jgi:hypothetical protein
MCRKALELMLAIVLAGGASVWASDSQVLAEVRFIAHNGAEKKAGVWVDGQYVGYVKELNGDKKMLLLPGKHQIVVRQAWYQDYVEQALLEPGEIHTIKLAMAKQSSAGAAAATSELKIAATPPRAAVFVDEQFAGHVDEFDGAGKAMLLTPGQHRVRIALPGYLPFETTVELRPHQKLKLQTELERGSIADAGSLVSKD